MEHKMKKVVYILRGLPGSGKSTLALDLVGGRDYLVFEADKFHYVNGEYKWDAKNVKWAHEQNFLRFSEYITSGLGPLVVSNTNTQEWEFQKFMDSALTNGYQVFTIIVENRHGGTNIHNVPEEAIQRMRDRFEVKL